VNIGNKIVSLLPFENYKITLFHLSNDTSHFFEVDTGTLHLEGLELLFNSSSVGCFFFLVGDGSIFLKNVKVVDKSNCECSTEDQETCEGKAPIYSFIHGDSGIVQIVSSSISSFSDTSSLLSVGSSMSVIVDDFLLEDVNSTTGGGLLIHCNALVTDDVYIKLYNSNITDISCDHVVYLVGTRFTNLVLSKMIFKSVSIYNSYNIGGVLYIGYIASLLISECVFDNIKTAKSGSAIGFGRFSSIIISYTNFSECEAENGGAALFFEHSLGNSGSLYMEHCNFLNNNLRKNNKGVDIYDETLNASQKYSSSNVKECSSTSIGVLFYLSSEGHVLDCLFYKTCPVSHFMVSQNPESVDFMFCGSSTIHCRSLVWCI
jgi:hypothetical protein